MGMEAANVAKELLETSEQTISALRQQLSDVVNESKFKKIIIYVDDLDRIEPRNAVAILELLKNIFSVPRCVFILAIDYQVVVKGLEHKFGKQTAENEWEFRAFFDKIIQLPFMMPMGQYNIGKYVNALLVDIGFVKEPGLDEDDVRQIILQTIGGNPRSIKRLVNSVSLIQIFVKNKENLDVTKNTDGEEEKISEEDEKMLMFSLLCLQIAFPPIYSLLSQQPDFTSWNEKFAFKQTNRIEERLGDMRPEEMKQIFEEEFNAAKDTEDFDEAWEQSLYRICYSRPRLKPRVGDISKFFSYLKDVLLSEKNDQIGEIIAKTLSQTSVTSVESTDQGQPPLPEREGAFKRRILDGIDQYKLDQRTNNPGFTKEKEELLDIIHNDVSKSFNEANFLYTGWVTAYIAKHKFFSMWPTSSRSNFSCGIILLKHFDQDFKLPKIKGSEFIKHDREYISGSKNSLRGGGAFKIEIENITQYKKFRKEILYLIEKSYDISLNHWKYRLNVKHWLGTVSGKNISIENDFEKMFEWADKYFSDEHTYEVNV